MMAPRDIIAQLPEQLTEWLHENLDRPSGRAWPCRDAPHADLEDAIAERLFPTNDQRAFLRQMHRHCQATAAAAGVVAEVVGLAPEELYFCGLLHDLGIMSALRHADEICHITNIELLLRTMPTLLRSSAAHAVYLAMRWRLPSRIRFAIRDHVTYDALTTPSLAASATIVAEHLAHICSFGFGVDHRVGSPVRGLSGALSHLRLDDRKVADLVRRLERSFVRDPTAQSLA